MYLVVRDGCVFKSKRCFTSCFVSFKTVSTTESETTEATTLTTEAQTSPTEPSGKSNLGFQTDSIRFNLNSRSKVTTV